MVSKCQLFRLGMGKVWNLTWKRSSFSKNTEGGLPKGARVYPAYAACPRRVVDGDGAVIRLLERDPKYRNPAADGQAAASGAGFLFSSRFRAARFGLVDGRRATR